jgi:hypothetical protein
MGLKKLTRNGYLKRPTSDTSPNDWVVTVFQRSDGAFDTEMSPSGQTLPRGKFIAAYRYSRGQLRELRSGGTWQQVNPKSIRYGSFDGSMILSWIEP